MKAPWWGVLHSRGSRTWLWRAKAVGWAPVALYSPARKPSTKQPSSPGQPSHVQRVAFLPAMAVAAALQAARRADKQPPSSSSSSSLSSSSSRPHPRAAPGFCVSQLSFCLTSLNPWMMMMIRFSDCNKTLPFLSLTPWDSLCVTVCVSLEQTCI